LVVSSVWSPFLLPPSFLHPVGLRPVARLQLHPPPPSSYPPSWHLTAPVSRSIFGRYIKTRLGYVRPPGRRQCRFGTPSGDPSSESPPSTFPSCHRAPLHPPASPGCADPYIHFLAQADTRHLSDVIFLCQGFIYSLCSPLWFSQMSLRVLLSFLLVSFLSTSFGCISIFPGFGQAIGEMYGWSHTRGTWGFGCFLG